MKHTPPPWKFKLKNAGNGFMVSTQDDNMICDVFMTNDPSIAKDRARLIAASPKLLQFAKARRDALVCVCRVNKVAAKMGAGIPCTRCEVDALIAEAEPEDEANARLIAAAPTMLDTLTLAPNVNDYGSADAFFEDYDRWWRGRCEAIKEATEAQ